MQIYLRLPGRTDETSEDFMALSRIFPAAARETSPSGPQLNAGASGNPSKPAKHFDVIVLSDTFALTLEKAEFAVRLPNNSPNIFGDVLKDAPKRDKKAIPIQKAADALDGHIVRIDHIGINVPRSLSPQTWKRATQLLSQSKSLYEYPDGIDGYDARKNLWLFMAQKASTAKFELGHDGVQDHGVVQFDLKTDLTRKEVLEMFPKGHQLPGLHDYFWSVPVSTRIPGMQDIRLDVRFAHDKSLTDKQRDIWESGKFFTRDQTPLPANRPARVPAFKPR